MAIGAQSAPGVVAPDLLVGGAGRESSVSAISWAAVLAGAFVAGGVTLILASLGLGIGLSSFSPWSGASVSATTFSVGAAIWLVLMQWLSAGMGGYVTGRLRTRWVGVHTHEVGFRDTANGLVTWAVATVIGAALFASAAGGIASKGAEAAATVAGGAAQGASAAATGAAATSTAQSSGPSAYLNDMLFRSNRPAGPGDNPGQQRAEAGRIMANAAANGELPSEDRNRLAQIVASQTGMSQADAERRVDEVQARAKQAADKARAATDEARKATRNLSIFMALSMLVGAFVAAAAAAYGGAQRDEYENRV